MKKILTSIMVLFSILSSMISCGQKYVTSCADISLFINEDYANEELFNKDFHRWITDAGKKAVIFFPKYRDIQYLYSEMQFYLYSKPTGFPNTTMVLELNFEKIHEYQDAKLDVYSQYDFLDKKVESSCGVTMPVSEFYINDYFCKVVYSEDFKYPYYFGIICTNDKSCTMRYLYCYSTEQDALTKIEWLINGVIRNSACSW